MQEILEICTDASLKTYTNGRVFTCSGAVCINTTEETYTVSKDSTNNRGELLAVYLGIKLAEKTIYQFPNKFAAIYLYSDSQFAIYGLRDWMVNWIKTEDEDGVLYGSSNLPVKNQELFKMIITYCVTHKLVVNFFNQKGHVNLNKQKDLALANRQFKTANGFWLKPEDIYKISFYNDIVDKNTRRILDNVNPDDYPAYTVKSTQQMMQYKIPENFKDFIK